MKRLLDLICSISALVVLSPLLFAVALILLVTGENEVFYVQSRVGQWGRRFGVIKFATMLKNSPRMGTGYVTMRNDPRVLPIGRWLRATKINELPQLLNVVKGDMSLVGPRPQSERCFSAFEAKAQEEIIKVKPGLTGLGSLIFRDEETLLGDDTSTEFYDSVVAPYKGSLEIWYVGNQSLLLDLKIILFTAVLVFYPSTPISRKSFGVCIPPPPSDLRHLVG